MNVGDIVRSKRYVEVATLQDLAQREITYSIEEGEEGRVVHQHDPSHYRVQFVSGTLIVNQDEIEAVPC